MSEIRFSGIVEEDMTDLDEEVFVRAGERVYGNLNYYGETPYIFGEIEDVDPEYVAPEFWVPVLPESLEAEIFGEKIPFARLRELAKAEREGNVPKLNLGDKVYWLPDTLSFAFGDIAEATISMVSKGVKTLGWKYRIFTLPKPEHGGSKDKYQQDISEYEIGRHYFVTQAEAERALSATEPKGDAT